LSDDNKDEEKVMEIDVKRIGQNRTARNVQNTEIPFISSKGFARKVQMR
jgi:hypothetical protein